MLKKDFYFLGIKVEIQATSNILISKLAHDFSFYSDIKNDFDKKFTVQCYLKDPEQVKFPNLISSSQSLNSITYDEKNVRYNDYYGRAKSIYDYANEVASFYSLDENFLHEIVYLFILSITGEYFDQKGLHKIHACAVAKENMAFVFMMPMKGGKSTLFLNLIQDKNLKIISDDSPIIDKNGFVHSFAIRVGINDENTLKGIEDNFVYKINRQYYGEKKLVNILGFRNSISSKCQEVFLFHGVRTSSQKSSILKVSWLKMIKPITVHMVIGLGLPIILEYFLKFTIKDFFMKTIILLKRIKSALFLILRAKNYYLYIGNNPRETHQLVSNFISSIN